MLLAKVADVVWQAIVGGVVTVVLAWMSKQTKDAVIEVGDRAAKEVQGVKETLEVATSNTDEKLTVIHDLVNHQLHDALFIAAQAAQERADAVPSEANVARAKEAETALSEHNQKQAVADAGKLQRESEGAR